MSQSVKDFVKAMTSTNDLSAGPEFLAVKVDVSNDNSVVLAGASTDPIVGIIMNKPKAGAAALVQWLGSAKATAGGTITRGDRVTVTTGGKLVTTTTNKDVQVGIALVSAVANDIFEVFLTGFVPMSQ